MEIEKAETKLLNFWEKLKRKGTNEITRFDGLKEDKIWEKTHRHYSKRNREADGSDYGEKTGELFRREGVNTDRRRKRNKYDGEQNILIKCTVEREKREMGGEEIDGTRV